MIVRLLAGAAILVVSPAAAQTASQSGQNTSPTLAPMPQITPASQALPLPPPPPGAPPTPRSAPFLWIMDDDYPESARRAREQGDTAIRVDVGANGRVTGCTITASSGSPILDATTCALLKRRARFNPARNAAGEKVPGVWSKVFHWRLPVVGSPYLP